MKILDKLNSPEDLKKLSEGEIALLCSEIREFLISSLAKTGGHLASNLGVVELTLALYGVFDAPKDKIIWDVGHQSYVSKIITGRKERFSTLRTEDGLSGFPKMSESEYDAFGTGHSSTALSAALGIARANKLSGSDAYTVAVIGDGAFSGGLTYEAMNNCEKDLNLVVILNENDMSISRSVGNMSRVISGIRSRTTYFKVKNAVVTIFEHIPLIGHFLVRFMRRVKSALKSAVYRQNIVEKFGFTFYGPVDGNDYGTLKRVIEQAKKHGGSAFIDIRTKKGKGCEEAEKNPSAYHMIKPEGAPAGGKSFSDSFGEALCDAALKNDKLCAVTAAMKDGTGLCGFFDKFPERAFDVGIAEGHAVTFAAGLSSASCIPVVAVYSSFVQRAYDNYIHDIAIQKLPCIFAIDRAGFSPDDGATHHGIFDVALFSEIADTEIYAPLTFEAQSRMLSASVDGIKGGKTNVTVIRYPKGGEQTEGLVRREEFLYTDKDFTGKAKVVIFTYGRIFHEALAAKRLLSEKGVSASAVVLEKIAPYDEVYKTVRRYAAGAEHVVFLEEGVESGSFGQNMACRMANERENEKLRLSVFAVKGEVPGNARLETLYSRCGISAQDIVKDVLS